ncbi:MAG: HAMP domain-containing histidine kinase [Ruminococcaceae bacterium]|nr:HAMP domain-containing histidine kinase [Oscillospiraceae bacterium]
MAQKSKARNKRKYAPRATGISWRLFGTLVLFVLLSLIVIWIFQIVLLNDFYEQSKMAEFVANGEGIFANIDNEEKMKESVYKYSAQTDMCIRLFKAVDGEAKELASSDISAGCMLHHVEAYGLSQLYKHAKQNNGVFTKNIAKPVDENKHVNTIYVSLESNSKGYEYILMMESELIPLNATVMTLQRQFGWIMCILIMGALIVALAISKIICVPLQKMSRSAHRLAKGDYKAEFDGGTYKEAAELAEALNYAADELAKNDNLQRELVANISHDLRTPLTMIKGYGEVIRDIPGENTPENVQVIIDETERLTELVNDMLDLSKIRAGTRKPERESFNLTETVGAVLKRYEKLTEKDGYQISFDADGDVFINADRTMILQVVYNLINNALNYTGEDKKVSIVQSVWDNKVRISVIDTGDGIAEKDIPYIWDRYYKVDKVHKRAKIGTGLGLSIVKGILESHEAVYGVESRVGEGSNFWFEFEMFNVVDDSEMAER